MQLHEQWLLKAKNDLLIPDRSDVQEGCDFAEQIFNFVKSKINYLEKGQRSISER